MAEMALKEETMPDGGIADFIISDAELDAMNVADAKREFGGYGIANFDKIASKMASYGRYGDDKLVHAETGELIVPKALIEGNPELKNSIFGHLREMGIEDPERYVVGSEANSLNPDTGLPEFFLKKVFKGVSKALKKAAPVVLPVALAMTGLGPVYGAALGSGLGTLIQGGDIEDALKNAVIAGGTGAALSGASSVAGGGTFMGGVKGAFADPGARFQQFGTGLTTEAPLFRQYAAPTAEAFQTSANQSQMSPQTVSTQRPAGPIGSGVQTGSTTTDPSFLDQAKEFIMPSNVSTTDALKQMGVTDLSAATPTQLELAKEMAAEQSPGFFRRFGPSIALAGLGIGAAGGFEAAEEDEPEFLTGVELLERDREKYGLPEEQIQYVADYNPFVPQRPVFTAEDGGVAEVFPRRTGGIMPDEGIPNEDSVRAMLMPGEFVMTTDAVKGLGNGDNEQGIRNMYQMMRGLEAKGRAMA